MKFLEKVKNMFTEEVEDDEVKVEKIKNEVTHVAIESPVSEDEDLEEIKDTISFGKEEKESKPIFFDDNDFRDLNLGHRHEKINEVKDTFKEKETFELKDEEMPIEKKAFKPTPIISPVYGILDKNYHKEDIVSRNDTKNNVTKESPIDTIRNKAYGTLEDELEDTLFGSNSILFKKEDREDKEEKENLELSEIDDNAISDLTDDISKELDELLVKKEKYTGDEDTEKKRTNKNNNLDDDFLGFIDSTLYKDGDE